MKCTNKNALLITIGLMGSIILTGCTQSTIGMPYTLDNSVSSFSFLNHNQTQKCTTFASDLCVVNQDITENTDVDMTEAYAAGLFDLTNSNVIYSKNIHERAYPASLTKVLTAVVAIKHGNLDDVITVTKDVTITESGAVLCGLKEGDTLTLEQALYALLVHSANDAGMAIAIHIAGSVEQFAQMMNDEAKALGATNSHFVNPHGLSDESHYVTAYDMYLIFNEAMEFEIFKEIIQTTSYKTIYHDSAGGEKNFDFTTSNLYLKGTYQAPDKVTVIGGKTGTTNDAGNCLILYAKDVSGNPYISIVLRSKEREKLYFEMTDLLDEV